MQVSNECGHRPKCSVRVSPRNQLNASSGDIPGSPLILTGEKKKARCFRWEQTSVFPLIPVFRFGSSSANLPLRLPRIFLVKKSSVLRRILSSGCDLKRGPEPTQRPTLPPRRCLRSRVACSPISSPARRHLLGGESCFIDKSIFSSLTFPKTLV